jgi:CheY-like chemotaxis protein
LPSDRALTQLAGFDHHVTKPYDPDALLGLLRPGSAAGLAAAGDDLQQL